jgi:hypothetical protein
MMRYSFLAKDALELLCVGIRLMTGNKPQPNLSVEFTKTLQPDICKLLKLYLDICAYCRLRSSGHCSLACDSFSEFQVLSLTERLTQCVENCGDVCVDVIKRCFIDLEITNPAGLYDESVSACLTKVLQRSAKPSQIVAILRKGLISDISEIVTLILHAAYSNFCTEDLAKDLVSLAPIDKLAEPELVLLKKRLECLVYLRALGEEGTLNLKNLKEMTESRAEVTVMRIVSRVQK